MKIIVDSSVWSLALRRRSAPLEDAESNAVSRLRALLDDDRVVMLGPIRQELLSGIRSPQQFEALRRHLDAFPDVPLERDDHVEAARAYNACRVKGVTGTSFDLLIAAVALRRGWGVLTTDQDFEHYARILPLTLY